jgi:hypothetical protein
VARAGSVYASRVSEPAAPPSDPEALLADARELVDAAASDGLTMRLLGGLAVYALAASARRAPLARPYRDFDLAVPPRKGPAASRVLEAAGLVPDRHFNALHGARRMIFASPKGYAVDVLIGTFDMAHRLEIADGFSAGALTIAPADLLLTKLQIVQIEPKDLTDAAALLLDVPIDTARFVAPLSEDWGFFHTVERNLSRLRDFGEATLDAEPARALSDRTDALSESMRSAPTSLRWKLRAKIGERVPWYETPEEVE